MIFMFSRFSCFAPVVNMKKVLKLIILMKLGQENSFYWHDPTVRHRFVEKTVVALWQPAKPLIII